MATLSHLLLLFSLLSLSSSAATTTSPLSLSPILSSLGFHDLAAAASSFPTTWHGPVTIFAPTPTSLHTCPSCSLPHLLQEHTLPGLFPLPYLRSLLSSTRIETLAPGRCLTLTHSATSPPKIFVSGVEITHPNLLSNTLVIVHVISGYLSHLSPDSCSLERMTSLSFPPNHLHPRGTLPPPSSLIMRLMLKDAILRLRLSGYSILSIALKLKSAELEDLESLTVFALNDVAIFSSGGHAYVTDFKFHVVPNRLILAGDLVHLQPGTVLPTMQEGKQLVVTSSSSGGGGVTGGGGTPARVNYVKVSSPDLLFNLKIAIHGVSMPIPHVNVTAAIEVSKNERSGYGDGSSSALAGDAGVPYSVAPTKPGIKWTAEIEDHHGL